MGHKWRQPETGKVFFRIVLPIILKQKKMSLPVKFARKYGDELSSVIKLRVPSGHVWEVQLEKQKDSTFFGAGLTDFFKYYSICYGYFLVFKYKGMSNFSVRIFDKTTCQIEYPFHEEEKKEDAAEVLHSNLYRSTKQQRNTERKYETGRIPKLARKPKISKSSLLNATLSRMPPGSKKAVELAMNSKPKNPSFLIVITKCYILKSLVFVPAPFGTSYLRTAYAYSKIKVEDEGGREWTIDTKFCWRGESLRLESGWDEFYRDNGLEEGDVCLFELIQTRNVVLKVSMFSAN